MAVTVSVVGRDTCEKCLRGRPDVDEALLHVALRAIMAGQPEPRVRVVLCGRHAGHFNLWAQCWMAQERGQVAAVHA